MRVYGGRGLVNPIKRPRSLCYGMIGGGLIVFCKLFGGLVSARFEGSERPGVSIQSKSVDLGGVPRCETPLEGVKKVPGHPNLLVRGD